MTPARLPASPLPDLQTIALGVADAPLLQRFFGANPAYFLAVHGEPAGPDAAREELLSTPPAEMDWSQIWQVGYVGPDGELAAFAGLVTDLLAPGVCHLGLFIVATSRHGRGDARVLYEGLEAWAREHGAAWMRLGVVAGNERAQRFWTRCGFVEARRREMDVAGRRNTVRALFKPLAGGSREDYLAAVARDRPEPPSH